MAQDKNLIANRYEVFQHIGQGGMADVFLAVDTILNRQVAIKILRSDLSTDAVSVLRFEREAQAATALAHPNIVEIYDVGEYKGHHYIVMEYVAGRTLKKVIQQRGPLLKEEAIDIMKQLCSAVGEAHRRGIIHRDLKPQNVIIKSDGTAKILDFGIALAKGSMQLTQANNVMGSVHYLAPELAKGQPATPQSDIYALGIVLYEMLSGDVPFKADSAVQVALMQMRDELKDVRTINPEIPQSLDNIIIRATAKDPGQRYRSCEEMLEDLKTCLRPERQSEAKLYVAKAKTQQELEKTAAQKNVNKSRSTNTMRDEEDRVVHTAVEKRKKSNRLLVVIFVILLLLLVVSSVIFALNATGILAGDPEIYVPELVGMSLTDARTVCNENSLVLDTTNVTYTLTDDVEKGLIIAVSPEVGTEVEEGTTITVTVSSGIAEVVGDYVGMNINDAQSDLSQYTNMKVDLVEEESDSATPGTVIRQELMSAGDKFDATTVTEIRLVYAAYPVITIPSDLVGKDIAEATAELEALGIRAYTSNLDTSNFSEDEIAALVTGVVIRTDPDAGQSYTQKEDNYVTIYYY